MSVFWLSFIFLIQWRDGACVKMQVLDAKVGEFMYANIIVREGETNLKKVFPRDDEYSKPKYWPGGYGQLSARGSKHMKKVGEWLRDTYQKKIPRNITPKNLVGAISVDNDAHVKSLDAILSAMFPKSQHIPVTRVNPKTDLELNVSMRCRALEGMEKDMRQDDEYLSLISANRDLLRLSTKHLGKKMSTLNDLYDLYESFLIREIHGYPIPKWIAPYYPKRFKEPASAALKTLTWFERMRKFRIGGFLEKVITLIVDKTSLFRKSDRMFTFFSVPASTMVSFMNLFEMYNDIVPPFGSFIVVELRKGLDAKNKTAYSVTTIYHNITDFKGDPTILTTRECGQVCDLDKYNDYHERFFLSDWSVECGNEFDGGGEFGSFGNIFGTMGFGRKSTTGRSSLISQLRDKLGSLIGKRPDPCTTDSFGTVTCVESTTGPNDAAHQRAPEFGNRIQSNLIKDTGPFTNVHQFGSFGGGFISFDSDMKDPFDFANI